MPASFHSEIVVIITGASSGIGQQAAKIFTQGGVKKFCLTSKFDLDQTQKLCLSVNDKVDFVIIKGDVIQFFVRWFSRSKSKFLAKTIRDTFQLINLLSNFEI